MRRSLQCVKLGAEKAFNYKTQDWVAELRAATGGEGVNLILDMVAATTCRASSNAWLRKDGWSSSPYLRGPKTELDIDSVMRRRLTLTGSTLRPRSAEFKGLYREEPAGEGLAADRAARIKPQVYKDLFRSSRRPRPSANGVFQHIGKIVLTV